MRKPDSRTALALVFATAAGIATAAFQPGDTPETNGLVAAKAVAARLADAIEERTTLSGIAQAPSHDAVAAGVALAERLVTD